MSGHSKDEKARLFGEIEKFVKIKIEGITYEVPEGLELLRSFQYLDFAISFETFCWNANCENCAANVSMSGKPFERMLCCQTPALEGMEIEKLPEGVKKP